jgi:hypothetical protein
MYSRSSFRIGRQSIRTTLLPLGEGLGGEGGNSRAGPCRPNGIGLHADAPCKEWSSDVVHWSSIVDASRRRLGRRDDPRFVRAHNAQPERVWPLAGGRTKSDRPRDGKCAGVTKRMRALYMAQGVQRDVDADRGRGRLKAIGLEGEAVGGRYCTRWSDRLRVTEVRAGSMPDWCISRTFAATPSSPERWRARTIWCDTLERAWIKFHL